MISLFQQRDFGEKINATFTYAGQQLRSFSTSLVYIVGPISLAAGIASGIYQSNVLDLAKQPSTDLPFEMLSRVFSPAYFLLIIFSLLANIMVSLTTYSHLKLYHQTGGGPVTVADVWAETQRHIGRSILFSLASFVVIIAGFVIFLIPGIYVAIVLSLGIAILVFEDADFGVTWSRCFQLIRDKWWSTFGLIIIMAIIVSIANLVFAIPAGVVNLLVTMKLVPDMPSFVTVLTNTISTIGGSLLSSLLSIAVSFQYFNLVERQQGTGLFSAIDSIGQSPAKPTTQDEGEY